MIKTDIARWYDVQCDAPDCEMMISSEYAQCIGWASPTQAVNAAIDADWERREEDGIERMYCPWHKRDDAYDDFIQRGWKVKHIKDKRIVSYAGVPLMICPGCVAKGQVK